MSEVRCEQVDGRVILALRAKVLRPGQAVENAIFPGDELPDTLHFAAFLDNMLVGCLSMMNSEWEGKPAYQLRGMAVDPAMQGKGVGKALVLEAETQLLTLGTRLFWCNAREKAIPFYESVGWRVASEPFEVKGIGPHKKMMKEYEK